MARFVQRRWERHHFGAFLTNTELAVPPSVSILRRLSLCIVGSLSLLCALSLGSSGCSSPDECDLGAARCDGNTAWVCGQVDDATRTIWIKIDCGSRTCVVLPNEAFCAISATPDPRCVEPSTPTCDGQVLVDCHVGFAARETTCTEACISLDDTGDFCQETGQVSSLYCNNGGVSSCELTDGSITTLGSNASVGTTQGAGSCTAQTLDSSSLPSTTSTPSRVYAYECSGGVVVKRTRCVKQCQVNADCTSQCSD